MYEVEVVNIMLKVPDNICPCGMQLLKQLLLIRSSVILHAASRPSIISLKRAQKQKVKPSTVSSGKKIVLKSAVRLTLSRLPIGG